MKIALVTGGSSGIGRATALELGRRGVGVITTYFSRRRDGEEIVASIEAEGGTAAALPLNLDDTDSLDDFVASVRQLLVDIWDTTHLDHLVNNAGAGGGAAFAEITEEQLDRYYRVNFKGPYLLTQKVVPNIPAGGAILNVGSSSALPNQVSAGYSAYAALKGAVHVVTPYWAKELADLRIRVNAIAPGTTRTRLGGDLFSAMPELAASLGAQVAFGRIGEPEDIARVIAFLLSDQAAWVTGQVIEVSGGQGL